MAKLKKAVVFIVTTALLITGIASVPQIAQAYSKEYTFDIFSLVTGKQHHELDNKETTTNVTAQTYDSNGNVSSSKDNFVVRIQRAAGFISYETDLITADGEYHTKNFRGGDPISKGTYWVQVGRSANGGHRIIGQGTIRQ